MKLFSSIERKIDSWILSRQGSNALSDEIIKRLEHLHRVMKETKQSLRSALLVKQKITTEIKNYVIHVVILCIIIYIYIYMYTYS